MCTYTYMGLTFTPLSRWLWGGKKQEPKVAKRSPKNSSLEGLWESDRFKFPLVRGGNMTSTSRSVEQKWTSRNEQKIDKEYDAVVVLSDGGCLSGSESDDSDWSTGWSEPHGPGFQDDDDSDDSFAVLVPCYGRGRKDVEKNPKGKFVDTIPHVYAAENKKHKEQWLSSLRSS